MQELRKQLSLTEEELHQLKRDKERMTGAETDHLQSLLREKEAFIKVCVHFPPAFWITQKCFSKLTLVQSGTDAGSGGIHAAFLRG